MRRAWNSIDKALKVGPMTGGGRVVGGATPRDRLYKALSAYEEMQRHFAATGENLKPRIRWSPQQVPAQEFLNQTA